MDRRSKNPNPNLPSPNARKKNPANEAGSRIECVLEKSTYTEKLSPQPQVRLALGLMN